MVLDGPSNWKIEFENGQVAVGATASRHPDVAGSLARVGLVPSRPVIVLFGGAATLSGPEWGETLRAVGKALVRAAELTGAAIVDGGTAVGVMAAIGAAAGHRTRTPTTAEGPPSVTLLGVAPAGLVAHPGAAGDDLEALEPHHSHFIFAEGDEWGDETELLLASAEVLAGGCPVVAVVAGGGDVTVEEVCQAARRGWPTFVLAATGGAAQALADRLSPHRRSATPRSSMPGDPRLQEIVTIGDLRVAGPVPPALAGRSGPGSADDLTRRLAWELQDSPTLKEAWERFARYDRLAVRQRRSYERIQAGALILGVVATLAALVQRALGSWTTSSRAWIDSALHWFVVGIPITASVLVAFVGRLQGGKRWVLFRGAAESVKAEIYQFRTWAGPYSVPPGSGRAHWPGRAETLLAQRLAAIDAMLVQTEVSGAALPAYEGPLPPPMYGASALDDGLSPLDGDRYLELRVGDQLTFYRRKSASLERRLRWLQFGTIAAGGVGTLLAALGLEIWVGLTTAAAGATLAHLGYLQVEATLVAYNQAAARLEGLRTQWHARPVHERSSDRLPQLVDEAESVLHIEHGAWAQQMSEAMRKATARPSGSEGQTGDASRQPDP